MSWINHFKVFSLLVASSLVAFLTAEIAYRHWITSQENIDDLNFRVMLFSEGDNFKNQDDFFLYYPNKKIRSTTLYKKKSCKLK